MNTPDQLFNPIPGRIQGLALYRFRAECQQDAELIKFCFWDSMPTYVVLTDTGTGEVDVVMYVNPNTWAFPEIRWMINQLDDCHVIQDTIEPIAEYTGNRRYGNLPENSIRKPPKERLTATVELLKRWDKQPRQDARIGYAIGRLVRHIEP